MKKALFIVFSCLIFSVWAQIEPNQKQNLTVVDQLSKKSGLVLTEDNLVPTLKQKGALLVQFYSEVCGHCAEFQPTWNTVVKSLQSKLASGRVNVDKETYLEKFYGIKETPSVLLFPTATGAPILYTGRLDAPSIVKFVFRKMDPILVLTTKEEVDDFVASWDTSVLATFEEKFGTGYEWSSDWRAFKSCAKNPAVEDYGFGLIKSEELARHYGINTKPGMLILRAFENSGSRPTPKDWENICEWITGTGKLALQEYSASKYQKAIYEGKPIGILYLDPRRVQRSEALLSSFKQRAEQYKNKITLFFVNDGPSFANQISLLGGTGKTFPTFIIQDPLRKNNYPYDDLTFSARVDTPGIEAWIKGFFDGKLRPKVKSEAPNSHNHEHIVKVTGQTFNSIVMDQTKDVLVEFYSPKCDHCKSFSPIYEAIGEALCEIDSVVIAQMDATNNDAPPGVITGVGGFPTLLLFPAKQKNKPIEFKGNKNVQEILQFIQKKSNNKFALPKLNYAELNEKLKEATEKTANQKTHVNKQINPIYKSSRDRTEL